LPAVVEGEELADELAAAVAVAGVERVGDGHRHRLVGRDGGRRLVDLGARRVDVVLDAVGDARVERVHRALHGDLEHPLGDLVEVAGAVDVGEVTDGVDARDGAGHRAGVADVGLDEVDLRSTTSPSLSREPREVVVEHADVVAARDERADEVGPQESRSRR
jgi:hypothetical protein